MRGARLPVGLRARRSARRRWERGEPRRAEALGAAAAGRVRARAVPGRAAAAVLAPRPGAQPLAGRARRAARRPLRGDRQRPLPPSRPRPLQDAFVAVRLRSTLDQTEPERRGNTSSVMASPAEMAARFADHPEAVAETARLAERLEFDLTARPRLPLPGLRGSRRRPQARRALPGAAGASATPAPAERAEAGGGWRRSCG